MTTHIPEVIINIIKEYTVGDQKYWKSKYDKVMHDITYELSYFQYWNNIKDGLLTMFEYYDDNSFQSCLDRSFETNNIFITYGIIRRKHKRSMFRESRWGESRPETRSERIWGNICDVIRCITCDCCPCNVDWSMD